jgi:phasin
MSKTTKTASAKPPVSPTTVVPLPVRQMAENRPAPARPVPVEAAYEKVSAATADAAGLIKSGYSTAVKGAQDYNNKFFEFAQANTNVAFDFAQKLLGVKSSSELMELSTEHARKQIETMTVQAKELAALGRKVTLATTEPLKGGLHKAFGQA